MSNSLSIALLIVGAALLLLALSGAVFRRVGTQVPGLGSTPVQLVIGLAGAALVAWICVSAPPWQSASAPAAAPPPPATIPAPAATPDPQAAQNLAAAVLAPNVIPTATAAFNRCALPQAPSSVPDAATTTKAQMIAAQAAAKDFDAASTAYDKCLDLVSSELLQQFKGAASAADLQSVQLLHQKLNNAAFDADKAYADRFNKQVRLYKAAHSAPAP